MSAVTIDDRDPGIVYSQSPAWQKVTTDPTDELDATKSGADSAGMTASFKFTGECIIPFAMFTCNVHASTQVLKCRSMALSALGTCTGCPSPATY